jgi:hypothetical protein
MLNTLTVRFQIPVKVDPIVSYSKMSFVNWLPNSNSDAICINEDEESVKIWFDEAINSGFLDLVTHPTIQNVGIDFISVDATFNNISDELYKFLAEKNGISPNIDKSNSKLGHYTIENDVDLSNEYQKLGEKALFGALYFYNRLISFFRNQKGQYWLLEYPMRLNKINSYNVFFNAQATLPNNKEEWFRWNPPLNDVIPVSFPDLNRMVANSEWDEVSNFVKAQSNSDLCLELIASAENLAGNLLFRTAIIEAVAALETAVNDFSKTKEITNLTNNTPGGRIDLERLEKQVKHLGFSATLKYLIPILFDETILRPELLKTCYDAIDLRGNVVHNGQRKIDQQKLHNMIQSIRELCTFLRKHTKKD